MTNIYKGNISGLKLIQPTIFEDNRGYFFETYHKSKYSKLGINTNFVQDNESKSYQGVLRGFHFQKGEHAQAKLTRVVYGAVYDLCIDLRNDSPTFGQHFGVELNASNKLQLYIPKGFAHGFLVLSETVIFQYKCDTFHNKESEGGLLYNSPGLNIQWPKLNQEYILSNKDKNLPTFDKNKIYF